MNKPHFFRAIAVAALWMCVASLSDATTLRSLSESEFDFGALAFIEGTSCTKMADGYYACFIQLDVGSNVVSNPKQLYLVISNRGTSDLDFGVWRIDQNVASISAVRGHKRVIEADTKLEKISPDGKALSERDATLTIQYSRIEGKLSRDIEVNWESK